MSGISNYKWDDATATYRYDTGKAEQVPKAKIEKIVKDLISKAQKEVKTATTDLTNGTLPIKEWRKTVNKSIKNSQIAVYIIQIGGKENVDLKKLAGIQQNINRNNQYLDLLERDIKAGKVSKTEALQRMDRYAQSALSASEIGKKDAKIRTKPDIEQYGFRVPGDNEHCPNCDEYLTYGVKKLSELIPPKTACVCAERCTCKLRIFNSLQDAIKAYGN